MVGPRRLGRATATEKEALGKKGVWLEGKKKKGRGGFFFFFVQLFI